MSYMDHLLSVVCEQFEAITPESVKQVSGKVTWVGGIKKNKKTKIKFICLVWLL